jgi:hypothetical protein
VRKFALFDRTALSELTGHRARAVLALVYTAVLLTSFEFWLLPARIEARRQGYPLERMAPGLESGLWWVVACVIGYSLIPLAIVTLGHRERPASVGYGLSGFRRHVLVYLGLFALILPFVLVASTRPDFRGLYPFVGAARASVSTFLVWEVAYLLQFVALESFFRGYLLFTLEKSIGLLAVFVMAVPYVMIHFHKPPLEAFGAIIAGIVLGVLALRYRSWAGGAVIHGLVAVTMDTLAVRQAGLF